jgi:hypothetical protein
MSEPMEFLTLEQLCSVCALERDWLVVRVREGCARIMSIDINNNIRPPAILNAPSEIPAHSWEKSTSPILRSWQTFVTMMTM